MNRRRALSAAAAALALSIPTPAAARRADSDLSAFSMLAGAFADLAASTVAIADRVDQTRFYYYLAACDRRLMKIIEAKLAVRDGLSRAQCGLGGQDDAAVRTAAGAAGEIVPQMRTLSDDALKLADAVKPASLRGPAIIAGRSFQDLVSSKTYWVYEINAYCRGDDAGRQAFRDRVEASLAAARKCQDALGVLIDQVRP